ncbi:hypothetical protein Taro_026706 [Colocasia esculenta]|uniref:Uncharacterized protein n=1 Tax=Colocasia esculenta TaxID=4460 RepID=A0A843VLE9_COLES|nr:hypothetical protein [Colocasia esculenta]
MAIQRMELLVLNALEWQMSSINTFLYLNYFASKFGGQDGGNDIAVMPEALGLGLIAAPCAEHTGVAYTTAIAIMPGGLGRGLITAPCDYSYVRHLLVVLEEFLPRGSGGRGVLWRQRRTRQRSSKAPRHPHASEDVLAASGGRGGAEKVQGDCRAQDVDAARRTTPRRHADVVPVMMGAGDGGCPLEDDGGCPFEEDM